MFLVGGTIKAGLHATHPSLTDLNQGDLNTTPISAVSYTTFLKDWLCWDAKAAVGGEFKKLPLFA